MKQILFFALRDDLLPILEEIEKVMPLKYTPMGQTHKLVSLARGSDIPNLGRADSNSSINCASYLVSRLHTPINVRHIRSKSGDRTLIDQLNNPDTVTLTPAGLLNTETLLQGRMGTVSNSADAQELMKLFHVTFRKRFKKIKAFWVGLHAFEILRAGKRLTIAENASKDIDLAIDPNSYS